MKLFALHFIGNCSWSLD